MSDYQSLITNFNQDKYGNPVSIYIPAERQGVNSTNYTVSMGQIPEQFNRVSVISPSGMREVQNPDEIVRNSYYVDYNKAIIYFHETMAGKTVMFAYYGLGMMAIGAERIFTNIDQYGNIIETLEQLLKEGQHQIDILKVEGSGAELMTKMKQTLTNCNNVQKAMQDFLNLAMPINATLEQNIETGTTLKNNLNNSITVGNSLYSNLTVSITNGNTLLNEMKTILGNYKTVTDKLTALDSGKMNKYINHIGETGADINNIKEAGIHYMEASALNRPSNWGSAGGSVLNVPFGTGNNPYLSQMGFGALSNKIALRNFNRDNSTWTSWDNIDIGNTDNLTTASKQLVGGINELNTKIGFLRYVNVLDYGAKGDGSTDDTTAFKNAITACQSSGRVLYIPKMAKPYIISESLITENISIESNGATLKQKDGTITNGGLIHFKHSYQGSYDINYSYYIKNLIIEGNYANVTNYQNKGETTLYNTNQTGLMIKGCHNCTFENIKIRNCGMCGIVFGEIGGDTGWNGQPSTNTFHNVMVYGSGRYNVFVDTVANDNTFSQCNFGASKIVGVQVNGGSNSFNDCVIWGNGDDGMIINAPQTMVRNCNIEGNYKRGIWVTNYGSHSQINSNKFMANNSGAGASMMPHILYSKNDDVVTATGIQMCNNIFKGASGDPDGAGLTTHTIELIHDHTGFIITGNSIGCNTSDSSWSSAVENTKISNTASADSIASDLIDMNK